MVEEQDEIIEQSSFLAFIKVETNNTLLYKSFIDKIEAVDNNIQLCRDNNNTVEVLLGTYSEEKRDEVLKKLQKSFKNESYKIDLTQEEFDKRCNY